MKKIIISILSLIFVLPCVLFISGCKKKEYVAEVVDVNVEFVSTDFVMTNKTITITYGDKIQLSAEDFKVIAFYSDGTNKVLSNSDSEYDFSSTIPNDNITPSGNYNIKISYLEFEENFTIIVTKDVVDMSVVEWNYSSAYTYDGTQKSVALVGLPNGVSVTYSGSEATDAGTYTAVASFTYENAENFQPIPNKTLTWTISPAEFEVTGTAKLKDEFKNLIYKGNDYTIDLDLSEFDEEFVRATIDESTITAKNAGTYYARVNLDYIGTNKNYNRLDKNFVTVEWKIEKAPLTITAKDHTITYGDYAPELDLDDVIISGYKGTDDNTVLKGNLEFELSYKVGDNVGDNYIITPKYLTSSNYEISFVAGKLTVNKAKIDFAGIEWVKAGPYTYTGSEIKPVLNGGANYVDIKYSYTKVGGVGEEPINVGTYVASAEVVLSNQNYEIVNNFIQDFQYQIVAQKVNVNSLVWNTNSSLIYTGEEVLPEIIDLPNTLNVVYLYKKNGEEIIPVNVGTYVAYAELTTISNNYEIEGNFIDLTFEITAIQVDCSSLAWTSTTQYTYNKTSVKPELTQLPEGIKSDYTYKLVSNVSSVVENPTNAGEYIVYVEVGTISDNYVITNYTELEALSFVINKAEIDITGLSWNTNETEFEYTGRAIKPVLNKNIDNLTFTYTYTQTSSITGNVGEVDPINMGSYSALANFTYDIDNYVLIEDGVESLRNNMLLDFNIIVNTKEVKISVTVNGVTKTELDFQYSDNDGSYFVRFNGMNIADIMNKETDKLTITNFSTNLGTIFTSLNSDVIYDVSGSFDIEVGNQELGYGAYFFVQIDSASYSIILLFDDCESLNNGVPGDNCNQPEIGGDSDEEIVEDAVISFVCDGVKYAYYTNQESNISFDGLNTYFAYLGSCYEGTFQLVITDLMVLGAESVVDIFDSNNFIEFIDGYCELAYLTEGTIDYNQISGAGIDLGEGVILYLCFADFEM